MVGRVTSHDPSVNSHGVPYQRIAEETKAAQERAAAAYRAALRAWLRANAASGKSKPSEVQKMRRKALELTNVALS